MSLAVSKPVLKATALTKRYGKARGIEHVSFEVSAGEVFGFLGPNGAGKTTTMRVFMDAIRPTSGRAESFGLGATDGKRDIHRRVGYLPGDVGLAERILVRDRLRYHANLRGGVDWARVEMLAKHLELDVTRQVKHLSRGNQQKAGIVQAFMAIPSCSCSTSPRPALTRSCSRRSTISSRTARGSSLMGGLFLRSVFGRALFDQRRSIGW